MDDERALIPLNGESDSSDSGEDGEGIGGAVLEVLDLDDDGDNDGPGVIEVLDLDDDLDNDGPGAIEVLDLDDDSDEGSLDGGDEEEDSSDDEAEGDEQDRVEYDQALPTQHSYLGESSTVSGRTILDDDLIQEIPVWVNPGMILMPGQTVPLTIFRPNVHALMKRLIETTKTFGMIHIRKVRGRDSGLPNGQMVEERIGTTAEIFEYREPSPENEEVGLKIKVKGRQRFRVLSTRQQIDGNRLASVEILREVKLSDPFYPNRLRSRDRLRKVTQGRIKEIYSQNSEEKENEEKEEEQQHAEVKKRRPSSVISDGFHELMDRIRKKPKPTPENKQEYIPKAINFIHSPVNPYRNSSVSPPLSPFPHWVFEMYDDRILVERVHEALTRCSIKLFSKTPVSVPTDPVELSYWVATNLPFQDAHRLELLKINCATQRLRYELSLLNKSHVLCCTHCLSEIGRQDDIFSMSQEGPQSAYVNPGGVVHETLTLYKAKNIQLVGEPSTVYSWFPGYAWTIAQCRQCDGHLGWKFTATNRKLSPKKFWGISRGNIKSVIELVKPVGEAAAATAREDDNFEEAPLVLPVM